MDKRQTTTDDKHGAMSFAELASIWLQRDKDVWAEGPEPFVTLAGNLLRQGGIFLAHDVACAGLEHAIPKSPSWIRLKQIVALALARSGAHTTATRILEELLVEGIRDAETLSITAARHKECNRLKRALSLYLEAYELSGDFYPGINAATLCVLLGQNDLAQELATAVHQECQHHIETHGADYWACATLGEACLVLEDLPGAKKHFQEAREQAHTDFGLIGATRKQVRRLLQHTGVDFDLDSALAVPPIVYLEPQPFAAEIVSPREIAKLQADLAAMVLQLQVPWVVGVLLSTCDAAALYAVAHAGTPIHLILPCARGHVETYCASFNLRDGLAADFAEILLARTSAVTLVESADVTDVLADYLAKVGPGIAALKTVPFATSVRTVSTDTLCARRQNPQPPDATDLRKAIKAIFFADVVGYSEFSEHEVLLYLKHFATRIGALADDMGDTLEVRNTWGDAQYFIFDTAESAGRFALNVRDFVTFTNWESLGFERRLKIRMGLHVGPVYECNDPVTGAYTFTGTHVGKAARIEPVADENQVLVSEEFAAIISAEGNATLQCEYVGTRALAKQYGERRLFLLSAKDS